MKKSTGTPIANSRLLHAIERIESETLHKSLTLGELVTLLGDMGNGILIILFCLIFLQPIPLPGISTPIGAIIIILATLQFSHKPPWIPKRFCKHVIPQKALHRVSEVARKIWSRLERWMNPRFLFLLTIPFFRFVNLSLIVMSALFLALPLPIPFSNTVPAVVILSVTFAQLEDDGALIIAAYLMSLFMFAFFLSLGAGAWSYTKTLG